MIDFYLQKTKLKIKTKDECAVEATTEGFLCKKMFLKISQYSQKNICVGVSLHRCFPMEFAKFLRTPILKNICEQLLLLALKVMAFNNDCFID